MSVLNADQLRYLLENEIAEDSSDEDEVDFLEIRESDSSENEELEEEQEMVVNREDGNMVFSRPIQSNPESSLPVSIDSPSETDFNFFDQIYGPGIILGRKNKTMKNDPFTWYSKPNKEYQVKTEYSASILQGLENKRNIQEFFKLIFSPIMIKEIVDNTNKRISRIDKSSFNDPKYNKQLTVLTNKDISINEMYAFIGILILLGITKKSHVSISELWSESSIHFAPFAVSAMSRERFTLITKNITFDDLGNYFDQYCRDILYNCCFFRYKS